MPCLGDARSRFREFHSNCGKITCDTRLQWFTLIVKVAYFGDGREIQSSNNSRNELLNLHHGVFFFFYSLLFKDIRFSVMHTIFLKFINCYLASSKSYVFWYTSLFTNFFCLFVFMKWNFNNSSSLFVPAYHHLYQEWALCDSIWLFWINGFHQLISNQIYFSLGDRKNIS